MAPDYLVTHSGGFHADELLSSVVLTRLFPNARIVRSRDPHWIAAGPDRVVYDVGGAFDADAWIFDHHQRGAPLRADGQPYSSFGLIWKYFGHEYLEALDVPAEHINDVHAGCDSSFVLPVDLADNGIVRPDAAGVMSGLSLPGLLETLKPAFDDTNAEAETNAFHAALAIARAFLQAQVSVNAAQLRAETLVAAAIADAGSSPVLELPMGMPFRKAVQKAGADHLLFVIHPRGQDWSLGGIRLSEDTFDLRADLPAAWAGLSGAALEAVSGVPGATFCHKGRFIAAARTRSAILAMANLAVKAAQTAS